jgi:hypothetical protein
MHSRLIGPPKCLRSKATRLPVRSDRQACRWKFCNPLARTGCGHHDAHSGVAHVAGQAANRQTRCAGNPPRHRRTRHLTDFRRACQVAQHANPSQFARKKSKRRVWTTRPREPHTKHASRLSTKPNAFQNFPNSHKPCPQLDLRQLPTTLHRLPTTYPHGYPLWITLGGEYNPASSDRSQCLPAHRPRLARNTDYKSICKNSGRPRRPNSNGN